MPESISAMPTSGRPGVSDHALSMLMPLAPSFLSASRYAGAFGSCLGRNDQ